MIEPRIYRAALLPALLAVLVAMFSVESRPSALPRGLAADELFDAARSATDAEDLLEAGSSRAPATGSSDTAAAQFVAESFAESGFDTRIDRFEDSGRRLANVVGRRAGAASSDRQIVVVAERDPAAPGGRVASAADTAALLELGRALEGRPSRRTVTLVSLAGAELDEAGARRLAAELDPASVEGVLAVSGFGARRSIDAPLVPWSNDARRTGPRLSRTASDALRQELGALPGQESVPAQLVRLGFPLGLGAQGVMLERGIESVRISGSGELPARERSLSTLDEERASALGRALLRTISALDERGLPAGEAPGSYLVGERQVIPGWSVALFALALMVPAVVTVADGFARAGRRRGRVGAWVVWTLAGAAPFALAYGLLRLLDLVGLVPGLSVAVAPAVAPPTAWAVVLLVALVLLTGGAWFFGRRALVRRVHGLTRPSAPAAGAAVALTVCVAVLAIWGLDPIAALFLVPAVHLWSAGAISERPRLGLVLIMAGLVLPLAVAVFYLERLSLGPLEGVWYLTLLTAGGHVSAAVALLACVLAGSFCSLVAVLAARAGAQATAPPSVPPDQPLRGPLTYAGPGSLGGTRSALRR